MKTLHQPFEDGVYNEMNKFKEKLTWKEFIIFMFEHCKEAKKRGDFEILKK